MSTSAQSVRPVHWLVRLVFALALINAILVVGFPLYVIRPFRYQGHVELDIALTYLRQAPWLTIVDLVFILLTGRILWRASALRPRARIKHGLIVLAVTVVAFCAVAARVNIFEKMFHPISSLRFLSTLQAKLAPDDMVMAVTIGGESHAYPVREMAYHHVVNDTVGGTPVVGTY